MARVHRSRLATRDLRDIWTYIATDNPIAADRVLRDIAGRCRMLAEMPAAGRPREELFPGLRSLAVGKYVLFYRIASNGIDVVRILHGSRDMSGDLFDC